MQFADKKARVHGELDYWTSLTSVGPTVASAPPIRFDPVRYECKKWIPKSEESGAFSETESEFEESGSRAGSDVGARTGVVGGIYKT